MFNEAGGSSSSVNGAGRRGSSSSVNWTGGLHQVFNGAGGSSLSV